MHSSPKLIARFVCRVAIIVAVLFPAQLSYSWWFWTPGDTVDDVGYHPNQPLPFNHKLHAGDTPEGRGIKCQYCHSSARRSSVAGIPSGNTCNACHKVVALDKEPIKYLTEKYKGGNVELAEPIEWTKVHDLPDFVRFPHKRHVLPKTQGGAELDCSECHGDVKNMTTAVQQAPLQMGWCIGCHVKRGAPTNCTVCHH